MLKTYLNTVPFPKFIIIEDTVHTPGKSILEYVLKQNLEEKHLIKYLTFEGCFKKTVSRFSNNNVIFYDFVSDGNNWFNQQSKGDSIQNVFSKVHKKDVLIIDSLVNLIFTFGLAETYQLFNKLLRSDISQVLTVIHRDMLKSNEIVRYFQHLCSMSISLESSDKRNRANYTYKKSAGKIIKQIEEYAFENGEFVTYKIQNPDPKDLVKSSEAISINPEDLTTFQIALTEKEKETRDKLVLPYLPKANAGEGEIHYEFDEIDDWDEEDPDDDLDI